MDMDWEVEWDELSNNEPWAAGVHLAGSNYAENGSGFPEPVPPLILCHAHSLTLYFEIQHGGIIQTSADALKLAEPTSATTITVAATIMISYPLYQKILKSRDASFKGSSILRISSCYTPDKHIPREFNRKNVE